MQESNLTILTIKLGKIHNEILKYIAPYFNLAIGNSDVLGESFSESDSD